jgi:hypothetical protein
MQSLLAVAARLACPCWDGPDDVDHDARSSPHPSDLNPGSQQIEELRAEIGRLKAERATDTGSGSGPVTVGMTVRSKPASSQLVVGNDI